MAIKYITLSNGKNIWVSDYFSKNSINYTGSSKIILDFDSNKILAKNHLIKYGIRTAKFFTAIPAEYKNESDLPLKFPLFLKPIDAANGQGIDDLSYVTNFNDFEDKVLLLYNSFNIPALVEEYLSGKEYTVSIIKQGNNHIVSPVEIVPQSSSNGLRILGQRAKKEDLEEFKSIDNNEDKAKVISLAVESFINLKIRDYGRIDIKMNQQGECFLWRPT